MQKLFISYKHEERDPEQRRRIGDLCRLLRNKGVDVIWDVDWEERNGHPRTGGWPGWSMGQAESKQGNRILIVVSEGWLRHVEHCIEAPMRSPSEPEPEVEGGLGVAAETHIIVARLWRAHMRMDWLAVWTPDARLRERLPDRFRELPKFFSGASGQIADDLLRWMGRPMGGGGEPNGQDEEPPAIEVSVESFVGLVFDSTEDRILGAAWAVDRRAAATSAAVAAEAARLIEGGRRVCINWGQDGVACSVVRQGLPVRSQPIGKLVMFDVLPCPLAPLRQDDMDLLRSREELIGLCRMLPGGRFCAIDAKLEEVSGDDLSGRVLRIASEQQLIEGSPVFDGEGLVVGIVTACKTMGAGTGDGTFIMEAASSLDYARHFGAQ